MLVTADINFPESSSPLLGTKPLMNSSDNSITTTLQRAHGEAQSNAHARRNHTRTRHTCPDSYRWENEYTTMENISKRVDVKLINNRRSAEKLSARPNFKHLTICDENLIAIHMKRTKLVFDKPVYCGMSILDISKTLMYDFHYGYKKKKYGTRAELLFTDTDSLMYEIETEDFYEDIKSDVKSKFNTNDFPEDHPTGNERCNKKVIGMMKDEAAGKIIKEFVGLRAKLYSFKIHEGKAGEKKCKGVKKSVVKKKISHQDYKDCLFGGGPQMRKMNVIRSHRHEIFTETVNKVALSANDDKRVIMGDGIHTLAHGHCSLAKRN